MKPITIICIVAAVCITSYAKAREGAAANKTLLFIENKGQITDQYGKPRRDIDYKLDGGSVTMFVGGGELHYQWTSTPKSCKGDLPINTNYSIAERKKSSVKDLEVSIYRMDVTLLGANKNAWVVAEDVQPYYENYYLPATPDGANARSYRKITYKNIYPYIDWVLYTADNDKGVKYDFIVHPGGNPADIQIQYNGASSLKLVNGALVATTPYGSITEDAPYSYDAGSKEEIVTTYQLQGNVLSFDVVSDTRSNTLVIDPSLRWATYYGDSGLEGNRASVAADTAGNVYMAGETTSTGNIATTGAHQSSYGGGSYDCYIVKLNEQGVRQWASYYGGSDDDANGNIAVSLAGDVYVTGHTQSTSGIATTGAFQTTKGAAADAFLLKLNTNGVRQWATYYGGAGAESGAGICYMPNGDVCFSIGGVNASGLGTTGTFAPNWVSGSDGMLIRFSPTGNRIWATYYHAGGLCADFKGNIYLGADLTSSLFGATTGAHQTIAAGSNDMFLTKFTGSGNRLWATYCGGNQADDIQGLGCDAIGNIYITGITLSTTGIATPGSHQPSYIGPWHNGALVKFDSTGVRQWGTYYGQRILLTTVRVDVKNNVQMVINTQDGSLATGNAFKTFMSGTRDALWAYFNTAGQLKYASYIGGNNEDAPNLSQSIAFAKGRVYIAGYTTSTTGLATTGAHQTTYGGNGDAFIAQIDMDTFVYIQQPFTDSVVCSGDTLSIPYGVTQSFRTTNNFVVQLSNPSGSFATGATTLGTLTGAQNGGVYNWIVPHSTTQSTAYRVRILATAPVDTAIMEYNIRISTTPQTVNATNNTPICSGNTINLSSTTTTSGVSYSWVGPQGFTSSVQNPTRANARTNHSGNYIVTFTNGGCIAKDTTTVTVDSTPVAITASNTGPYCAGSDIQLNATNTTAGASYTWSGPASFGSSLQNPVINTGTLSNAGTYTVYAVLGSCSTAVANTLVSVVSGPTVNIYPSPNDTVCGNTTGSATFNAVPAGAGTGFDYQWYKNGNPIAGATNNTYAATGIQTGDVYNVKLIPGVGAPCTTPVNSNSIQMTVLPFVTPSATITVTPDSIAWSGLLLTFTATANNAGANPAYQWKRNGQNQNGAISNTWGAANLTDNDRITCEVTSSYICPQPSKVTSNTIRLKISMGVKNTEKNVLSIYPNPAQDKFIIEGIGKGTNIQLRDVAGKLLYTTISDNTGTSIVHMQSYPAGTYLLILTTQDGKVIKELVVKE